MELAYQIAVKAFNALFSVGTMAQENPVPAFVTMLVIVVVVVIAKVLLKTVWGVIAYVIVPLVVLYVGYQWIMSIVPAKDLGSDNQNSPLLAGKQEQYHAELERIVHTPSSEQGVLVPVKYADITQAPDLTGKSFDAGLRVLTDIADTFSGEVSYCHVTLNDGTRS